MTLTCILNEKTDAKKPLVEDRDEDEDEDAEVFRLKSGTTGAPATANRRTTMNQQE